MMEEVWGIDYPELRPETEKEIVAEDQSDDDEPPILHRYGDARSESTSVSVKIIETPSTFLNELVERAKSKGLSIRSRNESTRTPKIPSHTSAFKPISNLGRRIEDCEQESELPNSVPAPTMKTLFRKITKEESDLMSVARRNQTSSCDVLADHKEMNQQSEMKEKKNHEMTGSLEGASSSVSEAVVSNNEAVDCKLEEKEAQPATGNSDATFTEEHSRKRRTKKLKTDDVVVLPMQRSRRASTVANSVASKSLFEMNVTVKKRRKRSSHSSDVENEMSPAPKRYASATESTNERAFSSTSAAGTDQKRKKRGRRPIFSTRKVNSGKKLDDSPGPDVVSPRVIIIDESCPWTPVGEPVVMNVLYQNDQRPERRWCYSSVRHKDLGTVVSTFDAISVGIEAEVDGRIEKSTGIAKVSSFFYDRNGNLSINLFWYYTPTDAKISGKKSKNAKEIESVPEFHERELLASKHVDVVPVEAIECHAYVLTVSEYNRFVAECALDRKPHHIRNRREEICPINMDDYPNERALPSELSSDSVYFSRYAYNFVHHRLFVGPQSKKHQPWGRSSKSKPSSPSRVY